MPDAAVAPAPASPAKKVVKKTVKTATQHPPTLAMVKAAINSSAEKSGSSLSAIKAYIEKNYKGIEMSRIALRIRKCLAKGADEDKIFIRHNSKCTGAHGKFRLNTKEKNDKPKKVAAKPKKVKKPATAKKTKATAKSKKSTPAKKSVATKSKSKSPAKKASTTPAKPKTTKKKTPTKKPKTTAKPKKAAAKPKKTAKK